MLRRLPAAADSQGREQRNSRNLPQQKGFRDFFPSVYTNMDAELTRRFRTFLRQQTEPDDTLSAGGGWGGGWGGSPLLLMELSIIVDS